MKETDNNRTNVQNQAVVPPDAGVESVVTEAPKKNASSNAKKSRKTRERWEWNRRLGLVTAAIFLCVVVLSAVSYFYHSTQTATTLLQRAEVAMAEQDFADQARWLTRYTLLRPDDLDAVVRMAIAADAAADVAKPAQIPGAVDNARRQLTLCIAQLGSDHADVAELRRRLINRLLQLGGDRSREAEKQIILLGAAKDDAEATRWLALALHRQLGDGLYRDRSPDAFNQDEDHWNRLANQKVGDVLVRAVKQDKDDIELLAAFLDTYVNYPKQFEQSEDEAKHADQVDEYVEEVLAKLRSNSDSRSKLVLYQFELAQGNESGATELLQEAAAAASKRLADPKLAEDAGPATANGFPPHYWDYLVVVEGTRRFADQDSDLVERWYDQLMSLQLPGIPGAIVERVYLAAGMFSSSKGNQEKAVEIWERALETVNPNSLEMIESIATIHSQDASDADDEFVDSLNRFGDAIEIASLELSRAGVGTISSAARTARERQIDRSRWKLGVLQSLVAVREGRRIDGINRLVSSLTSTADVNNRDRITVARQLASLYGFEGSWDKAAETLERAIDLSPEDEQLRLLASDAWRRSGNRSQAIRQWRAAGNRAPLVDQIAGVEDAFRNQLRLIPDQRDLSEVRASVKRIRGRLSPEARAASEEMASASRRLEIFEVSLPPSGVKAEEHLNSPEVADKIAGLATKYVDDQNVQTFAAERLAVMGRDEQSQAAVERLTAIVGESDSALAIVKARMKAASGDPLGAAQLLIEQAKLDVNGADRLLNLAAAFAARGNNPDLAYEAVKKIPADRRSLSTRFRLALLAKALPADSAFLSRDGAEMTPLELSKQLEDQLHQVEGQQGTYWRYLHALRVIDELRSDINQVEKDDARLIEGNALVREILAMRPNWGNAISLQGWLSAIAGGLQDLAPEERERKRQKAVDQLRAGLAAGDGRLETRQLLWGQLSLLNRWQEAEEELRRSALATDVEVDRYGALRIDMALRQENFAESLQLAESGIEQRTDDYLSYLVLCNTARLAAQATEVPEERSQLLQRAGWAIDQASQLATKPESAIYLARLQLALTRGDETEIADEISRVEESGLSEDTRERLVGRTRAEQGDYGAALEALERAQEINPSNQALLELAEIYRRMRRPDDEIGALRLAHDARPNDVELANRLARAIATRDGRDVDWKEIAQLLSSGGGASSNRLLHAIMLAAGGMPSQTPAQDSMLAQDSMFQGSQQQQTEAIKILRELIEDRNSRSDDAARILALLLQGQSRALPESEIELREKTAGEVRSIYESLLSGTSPQVADLYRYAIFLLEFGENEDGKIEVLQQQLQSTSGGMVAALGLGLQRATRGGNNETVPEFVQEWAESASRDGAMTEDRAASIAGASLLQVGLTEEALQWLDRAYRKNPDTLANYASALFNNGKTQKSIDVCASHFEKNGDPQSAVLLVESLVGAGQPTTSSRHQAMINSAVAKFDKNAALIEGVATLLMKQQSYANAASLYQQTLRINPRRVRALNNLAMVLSEIPGRQSEAIEPIERAIKLAGEIPELLDTKGVVLLRAGRLDDAKATLEKAIGESDDPRFRFHLIVVLLAQDQESEARREWASLNLDEMGPEGLMPDELETLKQLKQKFGTGNGPNAAL